MFSLSAGRSSGRVDLLLLSIDAYDEDVAASRHALERLVTFLGRKKGSRVLA